MSSTALVTDSTSCLRPREAAALGIGVVPLHVTQADRSEAGTGTDRAAFYRRLRTGDGRPPTSQPAPGDFLSAFAHAAAGGAERVLCVTCGRTVSGTHGSAALAADLSPVVRLQAERVRAAAPRSPTPVTVGHSDVPALADALADALEGAPGVLEVDRYAVAPSVGAHSGPGSFGADDTTDRPGGPA